MIDKPEKHTMAEPILLHLSPGIIIVFFNFFMLCLLLSQKNMDYQINY